MMQTAPNPPRTSHPPTAAWRGLAGGILLAGLTACTTSRSTREKFLERVPPPQPILNATAAYGNGVLEAEAWLGSSVRLRKPGEAGPGDRRSRDEGHFRRPSGSISQDYADNPFEEGSEDRDRYSKDEIDEMYGKVNYQYILPPRLALTLSFVNKGKQPLVVTITEVNSVMGNFAPRPETLMLGPGEEGRVDPMLSSFDNNFEALDVTVGIRLGARAEEQVLHLRRTEKAPPPAPPP